MKQKEVMIVDDDQGLCRLMTVQCRHLGLMVRTSPDAMQALLMIHKKPPDLIILDINMPAGNGLSVCEMLASDKRLSRIPVIMLSGQSDAQTIDRCRSMGAHFVAKSADAWPIMKQMICRLLNLEPVAKMNDHEDGHRS